MGLEQAERFPNDCRQYALHRNERRHDNDDCVQIVVCRCGWHSLDLVAYHEATLLAGATVDSW